MANWSKRTKIGGFTVTQSSKGRTVSTSSGQKGLRITKTYLPGGGIKTTTTRNNPSLGRSVQVQTSGKPKTPKISRVKKSKVLRISNKGSLSPSYILLFFLVVGLIAMFGK